MPVCAGTLGAQLLLPSPCLGQVVLPMAWPHQGPPGLPPWATMVLGRDAPCRECGEGLVGPTWQRHTLERGWDLHRLRQDPACPEKSSQILSPPHLGGALSLPSLCPSLGPVYGGGTLRVLLAQRWGLGHGSSIRPVSRAQLPCHLPARRDPSSAMEGCLAPGNSPHGHFPSLRSPVGPSGLHASPQHVSRGRGARVSVGLAERRARLWGLDVPAGSTGSVPASWLQRAPAK